MPFSSADAREWAAGEVTRMQAQLAPFIADGGKQDAYASALRLSSLLFWVLAFLVGTVQGGSRRCPARISASWCRLNAPMSISGSTTSSANSPR